MCSPCKFQGKQFNLFLEIKWRYSNSTGGTSIRFSQSLVYCTYSEPCIIVHLTQSSTVMHIHCLESMLPLTPLDCKCFTILDLASGYWQVTLEEADKEKIAFSTLQDHFEFNVMPFEITIPLSRNVCLALHLRNIFLTWLLPASRHLTIQIQINHIYSRFYHPIYNLHQYLNTSDTAIGGVLSQLQNGQETSSAIGVVS